MGLLKLEPYPERVEHHCWYTGTYSMDVNLDQDVVQIQEYSFKALVVFDDDYENSSVESIEWLGETPANHETVDAEIKERFAHY